MAKKQDKTEYDGSTVLTGAYSVMQEMFITKMLEGLHQNQAYYESYPKCKDLEVAKAAASRLLTNVNVKARLDYKRTELEAESEIKIVSLRRDMYSLAKKAEKAGKFTAAESCLRDLMKSVGGFQADKQPPENLLGKALDAETAKDVRKALEAVFERKYLALPQPKVIDSEAIE